MELLIAIICAVVSLVAVSFWFLWRIRRDLKNIKESLDNLQTSVEVLAGLLAVGLYLLSKEHPELLEKYPELEEVIKSGLSKNELKKLGGGKHGTGKG